MSETIFNQLSGTDITHLFGRAETSNGTGGGAGGGTGGVRMIASQQVMDFLNAVGVTQVESDPFKKAINAVMKMQRKYGVATMPIFLIYKTILLLSLICEEKSGQILMSSLSAKDEKCIRKLVADLAKDEDEWEGNKGGEFGIYYKSRELLYRDFIHLCGLFCKGLKAVSLPIDSWVGRKEVSRLSEFTLDEYEEQFYEGAEWYGKDFCFLVSRSAFNLELCKKFGRSENSDGSYELEWSGGKDDVLSYKRTDKYSWLELPCTDLRYSFVFICRESCREESWTMHKIKECRDSVLAENEDCLLAVSSDQFEDVHMEGVLKIDDFDIKIDKVIEGKTIDAWNNSVNYSFAMKINAVEEVGRKDEVEEVDDGEVEVGEVVEVSSVGEDTGEDGTGSERTVHTIDGVTNDMYYMILDRASGVPMVYGKFSMI